jgi:hypothetical protein
MMNSDLCPRGAALQQAASQADHLFKSSIVQFFSSPKKDEQQMYQLETLGACQRDADEAFQRHQRLCPVCGQMHGTALSPAGNEYFSS